VEKVSSSSPSVVFLPRALSEANANFGNDFHKDGLSLFLASGSKWQLRVGSELNKQTVPIRLLLSFDTKEFFTFAPA